MVGATGAAYAAVHPGRAVITSARRVCAGSVPIGAGTSYPPGPATAVKSPNPIVGCDSLLTFHATVIVHP
jgi:hypothetical protein